MKDRVDLDSLEKFASKALPMPYGPSPAVLTGDGFLWLDPDAVTDLVRAVRAALPVAEMLQAGRSTHGEPVDPGKFAHDCTELDAALAPFRSSDA